MHPKQLKRHQSILPGTEIGVRVTRSKDPRGDIERALKSWKRQLKQSGKIQMLKDRQEYMKPATRRKLDKAQRLYNAQRSTIEHS